MDVRLIQILTHMFILCIKPLISVRDAKIIGGRYAQEREFTYVVNIIHFVDPNAFICGGSILTRNFILSACHCFFISDYSTGLFKPVNVRHIKITAGTIRITGEKNIHVKHPDVGAQIRTIDMILGFTTCHDMLNQGYRDDYAFVKVHKPFRFSIYVQPMPLYSTSKEEMKRHLNSIVEGNSECTVMGWGAYKIHKLKQGRKRYTGVSNVMKTTKVHMVDDNQCYFENCQQLIGNNRICPLNWKKRSLICCMPINGSDACFGDSGGPLVCDGSVTGVVSFGGIGCGDIPTATVYASIYNIIDLLKIPFLYDTSV